jgi:hypothetical protein
LDDVYYGLKSPEEALDDAAAKSATVLGWWTLALHQEEYCSG